MIDFHAVKYLGSTALTLLVHLKEIVTGRGGDMVLCNVAGHVCEILEAARLQDHWLTLASRKQALRELSGSPLAV